MAVPKKEKPYGPDESPNLGGRRLTSSRHPTGTAKGGKAYGKARADVTKPTAMKKTLVKKAPPGKVNTAAVNKATGFTTGTKVVKATKSNPKTTSLPTPKPTATQDPWSTGKIGEFINSAVGQMTGRIPSPISGAMKNKTPVIPYTEKNLKAIKKARP